MKWGWLENSVVGPSRAGLRRTGGFAFVKGSDSARSWAEYGTCSVSLRNVDKHLHAIRVTDVRSSHGSFFFLFFSFFFFLTDIS